MAKPRSIQAREKAIRASLAVGASKLSLLPLCADLYLASTGGRPTFRDKDSRVFRRLTLSNETWAKLKKLAKKASQFTRYKVSPAQVAALLMGMMDRKELEQIAREMEQWKIDL